jgi:hypothetical protein
VSVRKPRCRGVASVSVRKPHCRGVASVSVTSRRGTEAAPRATNDGHGVVVVDDEIGFAVLASRKQPGAKGVHAKGIQRIVDRVNAARALPTLSRKQPRPPMLPPRRMIRSGGSSKGRRRCAKFGPKQARQLRRLPAL